MFHLEFHAFVYYNNFIFYMLYIFFAFYYADKKLYLSRNMLSLVVRAQKSKEMPARQSITTVIVELDQ
jgi:hypothetical protein